MKNRMLMSILALVSASLLLVAATFAWFTVSTSVNQDDINLDLVNVDASVELYSSTDGINYTTPETSILIENGVPGDTYYYRLVITNTGSIDVDVNVALVGFTNSVSNPLGYLSSETLVDAVSITASNSVDSQTISDVVLSTLLGTSENTESLGFNLAQALYIPISGSITVTFQFDISDAIGNDYRNLSLLINRIQVALVTE